ncbi:hypothetical protein [Microbispora amethystogenes]|uniref:Uncharacterized protein n=1 Tax=Microbispora amethystogenes TaxID=1427754 RepID=A0ABQ4FIB7_9ACTN|nr:hypothetical protein [Microbispora amethystogenes]GIH34547.1 hypothetical protein Mam01_47110 [Microbispora amethystogenes]
MSHQKGQGLREASRFGPMVGAVGGECREHLRLQRTVKRQTGLPVPIWVPIWVLTWVLTWVAVGPVC